MAFTVTARHAAAPTTSAATSRNTSSTTPTASSLLLGFFVGVHNYITTGAELSISGGGLTWTDIREMDGTTGPLWSGYNGLRLDGGLYRATVGASPSAFACSLATTVSSSLAGATIDITGHDTTTPVVNSAIVGKDNVTAGAGITLNLGFTPTVGNLVVVAIGAGASSGGGFATPTAGAGRSFTQAVNQNGSYTQVSVWYRVWQSGDSTTITCTSVQASADGNSIMAAAEIAAESGGGSFTGTAAVTLPAPTVAASGDYEAPANTFAGTAAVTLPAPTVAASGTRTVPPAGATPTVTLKTSGFADGDFGAGVNLSETLGALTFAADSLIVVALGTTPVDWATNQWTVTASGLTFTPQLTSGMAGDFTASTAWFTAPHTAGGSTTITLASSAAQYGTAYAIWEVTGHDPSTPIGATASGTVAADGLATLTLSAAPASSSVVLAQVAQDKDATADGVTVGSGWTEDAEHAAADYVRWQAQRRTGSTSTAVEWADINPGSVTTYTQTASAIELRGAAGSDDRTGTAAAALPTPTVAASGSVTAPATPGAAAVTLPAPTVAASGTRTVPAVTGTATVTLPAPSVHATSGRFPVTVSGRNLLDATGTPWFAVGDAPWSLVGQLTTEQITTYLEDRAAKGYRLVMFSAPENNYADNAPNNAYGDHPFTGTYFQSPLNDDYWQVVDHAIDEAARLGITCLICPAYIGCCNDGVQTELNAASNAQMETYGGYIGARYADRPNIMWLAGHDMTPTATEKERYDYLQRGIENAGDTHLWLPGGGNNDFGLNNWGTTPVSFEVDTAYDYAFVPIARVRSAWDASSRPVMYLEGSYENERSGNMTGSTSAAELRYQAWGGIVGGAMAHIYGCDPIWHFNSLASGEGSWTLNLDEPGALGVAILADWLEAVDLGSTLPDTTDTFLTGGEGSSTTQAGARFGTGIGLVYMPTARAVTLDLTEIATTCRITRIDPASGASTVLATGVSGSGYVVGSQGTNSGGDTDWALLIESDTDRTGTAAATSLSPTVSASGTATPPTFAGTSTVTLPAPTSAGTGTHVPPVFAGTAAITLPTPSVAAAGTLATPAFSGTASAALPAPTASAAGTHTPPAFTGTAAATLPAPTVAAAGTLAVPQFTGTAATTLPAPTTAASGSVANPPGNAGAAAVTLPTPTIAASGTRSIPPRTGTAALTLPAVTSTAAGTVDNPGFTGTAAVTLPISSVAASGLYEPPSSGGTTTVTLPAPTITAAGARTIPPRTGTAALTLPLPVVSGFSVFPAAPDKRTITITRPARTITVTRPARTVEVE